MKIFGVVGVLLGLGLQAAFIYSQQVTDSIQDAGQILTLCKSLVVLIGWVRWPSEWLHVESQNGPCGGQLVELR